MHLQQTKRESIQTGGAQYYFHELASHVKMFLKAKGAVKVALMTPYGATPSEFYAVDRDHKLDKNHRLQPGKVGHDRIQQGQATQSIGEAIRSWYSLRSGDFERIDLDVEVIDDRFYITPLKVKYAGKKNSIELGRVERPLTFTRDHKSAFWLRHLERVKLRDNAIYQWSLDEICRIVRVHVGSEKVSHVGEEDLLRASGPLAHLGLHLGPYLRKGYDCQSNFMFDALPPYAVPVEVKRQSGGFKYQEQKYGKELLSRAIVLCAEHTHKTMHKNIDVIELQALCSFPR